MTNEKLQGNLLALAATIEDIRVTALFDSDGLYDGIDAEHNQEAAHTLLIALSHLETAYQTIRLARLRLRSPQP